jgi:DNA-binding CsgD family transcriptional regulator
VAPVSEQELRILSGFSQGRRPSEIARELKITAQTLRNHLHRINQKLGTHTRMEAVLHAIRRNLITVPPAIAKPPIADAPRMASGRAVRQMKLHRDGQHERGWPIVQA